MTQKKLSQSFKSLLEAQTVLEAFHAVIKCCWYQDPNSEGDPPILALEDFQVFTRAEDEHPDFIVTTKPDRYDAVTRALIEHIAEKQKRDLIRLHEEMTKLEKMPEGEKSALQDDLLRYVRKSRRIDPDRNWFRDQVIFDTLPKNIRAELEQRREQERGIEQQRYEDEHREEMIATAEEFRRRAEENRYRIAPEHFEPYSLHILRTAGEPTAERGWWLHQGWLLAREDNPDLKHPFTPLVRAWLTEQSAKQITKEYDHKHPVATIEKSVLGSIRDVVLDVEGDGNLPLIHEQTPTAQQLELWESDDTLPSVLPWNRLLWDGISLQTKAGAVSHGVCVADEVFMEFDTGEGESRQKWELGVLLRALHPNLSEKQLTSNRKKYLTYVIKGLHEVQKLGWKVQIDGKSGLYIPIKIPQRFMPTVDSSDDFPIIFEATAPTTGTAGYMMVEKKVIRQARKKSANQINAAKTSYWLIDTYGTGKTKEGDRYIIDPTAPRYYHDEDGYVRHPDTEVRVYDQKGRPSKNPYKSAIVSQLPRDDNPNLTRFRVLSPEQRIRAVYPDGYPPTMRRATASKRADKAFDALEEQGFFRIDKSPDEGWRIMPSDSHVRRYRATRHAKEK